MVPADCTAANPLTCVDRAAYLHDMFLASDTTVALLSDLPSTGDSDDPLPFSDAEETQQFAASLTRGGASLLLLQNVVAPNFGSLSQRLDGMTQAAETRRVSAFKVYTAWGPGGHGFDLDDPAIGLPVIQHAQDLGIRVLVRAQGTAAAQLREHLEPAPRHGRGVPAVPRHAVRRLPRGLEPAVHRGPVQPGEPGRR